MLNKRDLIGKIRSEMHSVVDRRLAWRSYLLKELTSEKNKVRIFGAGAVARHIFDELRSHNVRVDSFLDNNRSLWGTEIVDGIKCDSAETIVNFGDSDICFIGVGCASIEVFRQLQAAGVKNVVDATDFLLNFAIDDIPMMGVEEICDKISTVHDMLNDQKSREVFERRLIGFLEFKEGFGKQIYYDDINEGNQYFVDNLVKFSEEDMLVDCGAYTGDTLDDFLKRELPFKKTSHSK